MEEKLPSNPTAQPLAVFPQTALSQTMTARADSPTRRGGIKPQPMTTAIKSDDLEELDEDEDVDEIVQEVEPPVDDSDALNDPIGTTSNQYHLWSMDWGDLDQERRNFRKRPALDDLPDDVREELASMSGADTDIRPKQKPKLEPPDIVKESSRGRKSPVGEEGISDISVILTKPAKTAEERLSVLEARDKLIRIRSNQQRCPKLKNMGKCPDMCPEKERYQRIARHQVDYYEYNRDTKEINLASMVKIYARSSADQQMPLPHDLRPVNVLWMTTSYLVNQFMDLADSPGENLGEWYHFLWDRMRSIRKDITQLALCDTVSVQILEMCARFHIFCMERLREEKMAVFDEKINRENLTKCLQSLQYMYNDLFLKKIFCPNEPEFQAYSILLHINSDLCTSTILGLRPEMRQHEKVKFAINVFLAVTMKNYVRFFKLVKLTTYLNACILHQYFAQVRAHAMHSIIRAYSRQKMRNIYPLSELQAQLLFDSIEDVLEFCRFSKVPVEESNIVLEKNTTHPIPMQEKMKRSFVGVECKREISIREIVAGGCRLADPAIYHKVHDSFDEQGILKQEAWYAEDQETSAHALEAKDKETLSKANTEHENVSSVHRTELSKTLPLQDTFGTMSSNLMSTQNLVMSGSQKSIFGVSKISSGSHIPIPSVIHSVALKREGSANISAGVTVVSDSSKPLGQQNIPSSSVLTKPVSRSSFAVGQSSVDVKSSFVFRLPDAKLQKNGRQGQSAGPGFASRTLQSIFGGSGAGSRSPGSSVLRTGTLSHHTSTPPIVHSTSPGYWISSSQDVTNISGAQKSENSPSVNLISSTAVIPPQPKSSDISINTRPSSSTVGPTGQFSGFFVNRSGGFWGSNTTSSLSGTTQSLKSVVTTTTAAAATAITITSSTTTTSSSTPAITTITATTITTTSNNFAVNASAASSQFPVSVYGLPPQHEAKSNAIRSMEGSIVTVTSTHAPFSCVSTEFSPSIVPSHVSDVSHTSPLQVPLRAVTVPTSIFGFHSRPLSTPQMFPISSVSSSITVSPHFVLNTPTSPTSSFTAVTGMLPVPKPATIETEFTFSVGKSASVTTAYTGSQTHVPIVISSNEETQLSSDYDTCPILKMDVDSDDNDEEEDIVDHNEDEDDHAGVNEDFDDDDDDDEDDDDDDGINEAHEQHLSKPEQIKAILPATGMVFFTQSSLSNLKKGSFPHIKIPQQKMDENRKHRINQVVREVFQQWRLLTYRSKLKCRLRSQEKCPPLGTSLSLEEQIHKYPMPQGCVAVDYRTRLEYLLDLEETKVPQSVFPDIGRIKLDKIISTVLPKALFQKGKLESNMFWKLCISLPNEMEGKKFSLQLSEWIDVTFSDSSEGPENNLLRITRVAIGEEYNLFTSVQKTMGVVKMKLQGVNGFLFFTPRSLTKHACTFERYQQLIQSASAHSPLPLVAVVSNIQWVEVCHKWFTTDVETERLAAFKIIGPFTENKECILNDVIGSISWLSECVSPAPPFERWPLREVLLTLMMDLWTRVRFSLASRCSSGFQQHPEDLLGLYHDALKFLHRMIVNDQLDQYDDSAPELEELAKQTLADKYNSQINLKDPECIKRINDGFSQVKLNIRVPPMKLLSVESFCESVCLYNPRLRAPISHFLCNWIKDDDIDWTYVVEAVTEIHIRDIIGRFKLKNLIVVLVKSEIEEFRMEPWYTLWLQDRLPDQTRIEETLSDEDFPSVPIDKDLSVCSNELNEPKLTDTDEKLLSDFESMLNELEELQKAEVDLKYGTNLPDPLSLSLDSNNKTKYFELDSFESRLEYYSNLLKN